MKQRANCSQVVSWIVEIVWASSSSQALDESDSCAFFFCVLSVTLLANEQKRSEGYYPKAIRNEQYSSKNGSKIDKISTKFRCWVVRALTADSGTFRTAFGTASECQVGPSWPPSSPSWPPSWRSGAPCWPSRAPSWLSWAAAGPLSSALPVQTLPRAAFKASFRPMLGRSRQARSLKFVRPRSVS